MFTHLCINNYNAVTMCTFMFRIIEFSANEIIINQNNNRLFLHAGIVTIT